MKIFDSIQKPTLLLDSLRAQENIARMAARARAQGIRFRPHFKTHQSAAIGKWFPPHGVTAITASSLDMARYFAGHGWYDITVAFPVNVRQLNDIQALAEQIHLGLLVESVETVHFLGQRLRAAVDLWIKVDVGAHRTGLSWDQPAQMEAVADAARRYSNLRVQGLLTHAGHTYAAASPQQVVALYTESVQHIRAARAALTEDGFGPLQVSVGDTPGCSLSEDLGEVDEIRPGNFIFYDAQQLRVGACTPQQVATVLACPVVALHPERETAVVYGGAIHLSKDFLMEDGVRKYGLVCLPQDGTWGDPLPGTYVAGLSQEHGMLHLPAEQMARLQIGDLVCIIPAHSCLTVQAMRQYLTLQGETIDTLI